MLEQVKLMLGITDDSKDTLLSSIILINTTKLLSFVGGTDVPSALEFIVIELTLERFNKLGSEGITTESIEGISYSYKDSALELDPYMPYIDKYLNAYKGKFRFL